MRNVELHSLYSSPHIIRMKIEEDSMGGACSKHLGDDECI